MFNNIHDGNIYKFLYSGEWICSVNKHNIEVKSPNDKKVLGLIQCVTKDEIDNCIKSSKQSLSRWNNTSYEAIKNILNLVAQAIMENYKHLSGLISLETGKKYLSAEEEVLKTYNLLSYITKNNDLLTNKQISFIKSNPFGTILVTPSINFPLYSTTSKVVAAIVTGNSVVLNPSIKSTLSVLHVAEIFNKYCDVAGIINTVTGILEPIYDYLIIHKGINFIDFIGEDEIGKYIAISSRHIPMNIQTEEKYISHFGGSLKEDISNLEEDMLLMQQKKLK